MFAVILCINHIVSMKLMLAVILHIIYYIFMYIKGTGTNACYIEQLENVHTWTGDDDEPRQVHICHSNNLIICYY